VPGSAFTVYTFVLFYLLVPAKTSESPSVPLTALTVCGSEVAVYSNGFPLYTIVGKGCLVVPLLGKTYTVMNNTIYFWNYNVTLLSAPERLVRGELPRPPLWLLPTAILVLRWALSTKADV